VKAFGILIAVLLVLFLLGQIRIGGRAEYSAGGFKVWVKIGRIFVQIFPGKPKKEAGAAKKNKPKKEKRKPKAAEQPTPTAVEKVGGALEYARTLLPILLDGAGRLWQKLRVDRLELELTAGSRDPADAAMLYGRANAALGAIWYPLTNAFHVRDGSARVRLDFDAPTMTLYAHAVLSFKLGQLLCIGIYFGLKALKGFLSLRTHQKEQRQQRKAV